MQLSNESSLKQLNPSSADIEACIIIFIFSHVSETHFFHVHFFYNMKHSQTDFETCQKFFQLKWEKMIDI